MIKNRISTKTLIILASGIYGSIFLLGRYASSEQLTICPLS